MSEKPSFIYVAYAPCGCVVAAAADLPNHRDHTADMVADFIREGYHVQRQERPVITLGDDCTHTPKWGAPAPAQETER